MMCLMLDICRFCYVAEAILAVRSHADRVANSCDSRMYSIYKYAFDSINNLTDDRSWRAKSHPMLGIQGR